jgi:hypothetical protein
MTVPSNDFSSQKTRDTRSHQWCQAKTTNRVGLLLIANSNDFNIALYKDHLFLPLIALSDTIKRIVVLLATGVVTTLFNKTSQEGLCRRGVLFDLGGNGVFWKKGCNAPRATDFREKRNPPQADSIRSRRQFELLFVVVALSCKHPRAIFINY